VQNVLKTSKKSDDFFAWFEQAAANNVQAAQLLVELCRTFQNLSGMADQIHTIEHSGDDISHNIYEQLNKVFMPPIDREDIIMITRALDDVLDFIHAAADAIYVYNVQGPNETALGLAQIIVACTEQVAAHIGDLRSRRTMPRLQEAIVELNRLENQADEVLRAGLITLFHQPHDPIQVVAWSKIYELMEEVTDKSEDIADVLRGLVIKHG
jgi:predicted phosphate transport protein (TIGR00153 family)